MQKQAMRTSEQAQVTFPTLTGIGMFNGSDRPPRFALLNYSWT